MNRLSLARKQTKILKKVRECQLPLPLPYSVDTGILTEIQDDVGEGIIITALEAVGMPLLHFAKEVDQSHPDLANVLDGQLVSEDEHSFNRIACDTLRFIKYAIKEGICDSILGSVISALRSHSYTHLVHRTIDAPSVNQQHVRLVADREQRDCIRLTKEAQRISCVYDVMNILDQHTGFDSFVRGVNRYQKDLDVAKEKLRHFKDLNLPSMASEIESSIEEIKYHVACDQHYGFNKLCLNVGATILAKIHGYSVINDGMVRVASENFPNHKFWEGDGKLEYWPRHYPYWMWKNVAPKRVADVVELLEAYPEANGKSLFDHYRLLVPGVAFHGDCYVSYSGDIKRFEDPFDVAFNLDKEMVEHRDMVPILLGERDGEHYFLCYWM